MTKQTVEERNDGDDDYNSTSPMHLRIKRKDTLVL